MAKTLTQTFSALHLSYGNIPFFSQEEKLVSFYPFRELLVLQGCYLRCLLFSLPFFHRIKYKLLVFTFKDFYCTPLPFLSPPYLLFTPQRQIVHIKTILTMTLLLFLLIPWPHSFVVSCLPCSFEIGLLRHQYKANDKQATKEKY